MDQTRFKSPIFWTSVVSAIALLLKAFDVYTIDDETTNAIVDVVLSIVTLIGIANNPSKKKF